VSVIEQVQSTQRRGTAQQADAARVAFTSPERQRRVMTSTRRWRSGLVNRMSVEEENDDQEKKENPAGCP
jgi:hypothetical protein